MPRLPTLGHHSRQPHTQGSLGICPHMGVPSVTKGHNSTFFMLLAPLDIMGQNQAKQLPGKVGGAPHKAGRDASSGLGSASDHRRIWDKSNFSAFLIHSLHSLLCTPGQAQAGCWGLEVVP